MPPKGMKKKVYKDVVSSKGKSRRAHKIQPVSKAVRSYVNRAIGAHSENKNCAGITGLDVNLVSMLPTTWGTVINLADVWGGVTQGTGEGSRIGNTIKPINWNFKGFIAAAGTASLPCIVKMYILKVQNGYTSPLSVSTNPTTFYNLGNSSVAPSASYLDIMRRVNKDQFVVYTTRTFKVGQAATSGALSNNDFKACNAFNVNLLKYQKHIMRYADATTTNPTNAGLYAVFTIANYDGTSGAFIGSPQISYDIEAQFEDA